MNKTTLLFFSMAFSLSINAQLPKDIASIISFSSDTDMQGLSSLYPNVNFSELLQTTKDCLRMMIAEQPPMPGTAHIFDPALVGSVAQAPQLQIQIPHEGSERIALEMLKYLKDGTLMGGKFAFHAASACSEVAWACKDVVGFKYFLMTGIVVGTGYFCNKNSRSSMDRQFEESERRNLNEISQNKEKNKQELQQIAEATKQIGEEAKKISAQTDMLLKAVDSNQDEIKKNIEAGRQQASAAQVLIQSTRDSVDALDNQLQENRAARLEKSRGFGTAIKVLSELVNDVSDKANTQENLLKNVSEDQNKALDTLSSIKQQLQKPETKGQTPQSGSNASGAATGGALQLPKMVQGLRGGALMQGQRRPALPYVAIKQ